MQITYQVGDHIIDLSRIKSLKHTVQYSGDNDKKRIKITYKYMVTKTQYNEDYKEEATEDLIFPDEKSALEALNDLRIAWEKFLESRM